jgi:hypothetical protein
MERLYYFAAQKYLANKTNISEISGSHGDKCEPSGMLRRVVWWKCTDISEVLAASETSVNF